MKNPKKREVTEREDMMCPRCQTEGLVANPAYVDEYDGRAELVKATRCPNEECQHHRGVPEDKIKMQMPESNIISSLSEVFGADPKDMATFALGLGVILLMAWSYGIGPFGSSTEQPTTTTVETSITGEVPEYQGSLPQVLLYQDDNLVSSVGSENGTYEMSLNNASEGQYEVLLDYPESSHDPPPKTVRVNQSQSSNITADFSSRPEPLDININQSASNSEFMINYTNPTNIESFDLSISPIVGETVERDKKLTTNRDQNILLPVFPSSQEYRIDANYTTETFNTTESYRGQPKSFEVFGNAKAEQIKITLPDGTEANSTKRTVEVPSSGTLKTISVASNETLGPAEVTLKNGTSDSREQTSGTWDGEDNVTIETGTDEFVQGTVLIEPKNITNDRRIEGTISGSEIGHEFKGNVPIDDAKIEFVGGDIKASKEGQGEISVDAEDGTTQEVFSEVTTIDSDGGYRLEWNPSIARGEDYVDLFYEIDGDRTSITSKGEKTLSLSEGQKVRIGGQAELETRVPSKDPPRSATKLNTDLKVADFSFSDNNPSTNQRLQLEITLENTGPTEVSDNFQLYQNGEKFIERSVTVPPGEQKTLSTFELGEPTTPSSSGTSVWYVNDRGPYLLDVGINERKYGAANLEAQLYNVGSEGSIKVDTNGTGNLDCEVAARGGICELGELEPGVNAIPVQEVGVSGTSYVIEYTSQENPRGVEVDVGDDGITDIEESGVLTSPQSETVELAPERAKIGIETENDIPITYGVTWQSNAVIDNPVVDVGGEIEVAGEGTFVKSKTFQIGSLEQGEHTLSFDSQSGGYTAVIEWREQESQSYPRAIINNKVACEPPQFANNLTCIVDKDVGHQPGTNTIEFDGARSEVFNFRVSQDARAIASNVQISVDNQTSETFSRPTIEPKPWSKVSSTSDMTRGENLVSVKVEEENNIVPEVDLKYLYVLNTATVEQLEIEVVSANGTTNTITKPEESVTSLQEDTITIKEGWLREGENKVRFRPKPVDGIFEVTGDLVINENEEFEFRTLR